jgi:hypothetical protein
MLSQAASPCVRDALAPTLFTLQPLVGQVVNLQPIVNRPGGRACVPAS